MLGTYHMDALLTALSDLHHIHEQPLLYAFVLNRTADVVKAQNGSFFTVREETGELVPEACKGVSLSLLKEIPFKMKMGIAGWCATNKKSALVENVQTDERFNRAVDVITGIRTRSVLCVPILWQDKILGILELVNRIDGIFRPADLEFVEHLARQVAVAIGNCQLYEDSANLVSYTNSVINSLSGGFISTNLGGMVTRFNIAAARILGADPAQVMNKPILQALPQYPAMAAILDVTQKRESPLNRQEIELTKPDGSTMLIGYGTFLIRNETNQMLGAAITFQDITRVKRG